MGLTRLCGTPHSRDSEPQPTNRRHRNAYPLAFLDKDKHSGAAFETWSTL